MGNNDGLLWGLCLGLCAGKAVSDSRSRNSYYAGRYDEAHYHRGVLHTHEQVGASVDEEPESDAEPARVMPLLVLRV